jgi:hypothetical protein
MRPYRTVLFVPAHKPAWVAKALRVGPDAIVLDLEDSVPDAEKAAARATARGSIQKLAAEHPDVGVGVRVNGLATRLTGSDLDEVVVPGLDVLFVPKVERASDLLRYDALVDHFEHRAGLSGLDYIVPIETAAAVLACADIATASPRVAAMIGPTAEHADIAREVGFEWTPEGEETLRQGGALAADRAPFPRRQRMTDGSRTDGGKTDGGRTNSGRTDGDGPLVGIRVLELGTMYAAPTAGRMLRDFGAEVVKVEDPALGDYARQWTPRKDGLSLGFSCAETMRIEVGFGSDRAQSCSSRIQAASSKVGGAPWLM